MRSIWFIFLLDCDVNSDGIDSNDHCISCERDYGDFNCSHGCQNSPNGRICTCPDNMLLSRNSRDCIKGKQTSLRWWVNWIKMFQTPLDLFTDWSVEYSISFWTNQRGFKKNDMITCKWFRCIIIDYHNWLNNWIYYNVNQSQVVEIWPDGLCFTIARCKTSETPINVHEDQKWNKPEKCLIFKCLNNHKLC